MTSLPELKRLAESATPGKKPPFGPWVAYTSDDGMNSEINIMDGETKAKTLCYADGHFHNDKEIFQFIAAANPQTILNLIGALEKLDLHFKELVEQCEWYLHNGLPHERNHFLGVEARGNFYDVCKAEIKKLVGET